MIDKSGELVPDLVGEVLNAIDHTVDDRIGNVPPGPIQLIGMSSNRSSNAVEEIDYGIETSVDELDQTSRYTGYEIPGDLDTLVDNLVCYRSNTGKELENGIRTLGQDRP